MLVRGVNWLGDAVMSTPALLRLRQAFPQTEITLLTHEKLAGLWEGHSAIDKLETFAKGEGAFQVGRRLREHNFDLALALPNSHRSAIELWHAGIPERVGYGSPFRNLFLTKPISARPGAVKMRKRSAGEIRQLNQRLDRAAEAVLPPRAHHIFQYLHLVAALGASAEPLAPAIAVSEIDRTAFRRRVAEASSATPPYWLGLNPGAEYGPAKRWPADRFVAAALEIHQATGCGWIIFGANDPANQQVASELEARLGRETVLNFSGKTTLRELCAGLEFCRLVLTNDTGPMHVAAAVGTRVVVPFGSTSYALTGPGLPGNDDNVALKSFVPCSPCFLRECPIDFRCMESIHVRSVVASCLGLLEKL